MIHIERKSNSKSFVLRVNKFKYQANFGAGCVVCKVINVSEETVRHCTGFLMF